MTYAEAKRTAVKLFGPGFTLKRGKHKCFVMRPDGFPMGDGRSWLEALRSAGTIAIMKNEQEAERVKKLIEQFRVEHPDVDPEKMTSEQLEVFDVWMEAHVSTSEKPAAVETPKILGADGNVARR